MIFIRREWFLIAMAAACVVEIGMLLCLAGKEGGNPEAFRQAQHYKAVSNIRSGAVLRKKNG